MADPVRRPLKSRQTAWASAIARGVARTGLTPNAISLLGVGFASGTAASLFGAAGVVGSARAGLFVLAAVTVQLRLLCNLLDGMVAVEGGKGTPAGEVFNDLPDRASDLLALVPAGYALQGIPCGAELGWVAGVLAVLTAYVRVLGGAVGLEQRFTGPMAKPHRMAVLTFGLLLASGALGLGLGADSLMLAVTLGVIAVGALVTAVRRTVAVIRALNG
ncbi:MAG TPA: CDP-alcohol phosphatidyltransferase family protein [Bacteroidetes bacterium]|nr:CDP-alcohol phosphatidyltransferase family protein [Bacteroidota bacterium]HIL58016.1 CDP-alcohol phosphatidyltransferase family protein [Rhodothermales bacterium]